MMKVSGTTMTVDRMDRYSGSLPRVLDRTYNCVACRGIGIRQNSDAGQFWQQHYHQLEVLGIKVGRKTGQPCSIAARPGQARDQPACERITRGSHDDRDSRGRLLCCPDRRRSSCDNDVNVEPDEFFGETCKTPILAVGVPWLEDKILLLLVTKVVHSSSELVEIIEISIGRRTP